MPQINWIWTILGWLWFANQKRHAAWRTEEEEYLMNEIGKVLARAGRLSELEPQFQQVQMTLATQQVAMEKWLERLNQRQDGYVNAGKNPPPDLVSEGRRAVRGYEYLMYRVEVFLQVYNQFDQLVLEREGRLPEEVQGADSACYT